MKYNNRTAITSIMMIVLTMMFIMQSCNSDSEDQFDPAPPSATEVDLSTLKGNYSGTWNSSTPTTNFIDYPISIKITQVNDESTKASGVFFATSDYVSCCNSGADDGSISLNIDNKTITAFTYNDIIPNCSGTFTGTGTIGDTLGLTISFTGTDCDGEHIGTLVLTKRS